MIQFALDTMENYNSDRPDFAPKWADLKPSVKDEIVAAYIKPSTIETMLAPLSRVIDVSTPSYVFEFQIG